MATNVIVKSSMNRTVEQGGKRNSAHLASNESLQSAFLFQLSRGERSNTGLNIKYIITTL